MKYELQTTDGKHTRTLTAEDCKAILRIALKSGWRPSPRHLQHGSLRLGEPMSAEESKQLASALERGLQHEMPTLHPEMVVAIFESIAVLRRGAASFVQQA